MLPNKQLALIAVALILLFIIWRNVEKFVPVLPTSLPPPAPKSLLPPPPKATYNITSDGKKTWDEMSLTEKMQHRDFVLASHRSKQFCQNQDSVFRCFTANSGAWERFRLKDEGVYGFTIISRKNNKIIRALGDRLSGNTDHGMHLFRIVELGGRTIGIQLSPKFHNGKYCSNNDDPDYILCNRNTIGNWEKFDVYFP